MDGEDLRPSLGEGGKVLVGNTRLQTALVEVKAVENTRFSLGITTFPLVFVITFAVLAIAIPFLAIRLLSLWSSLLSLTVEHLRAFGRDKSESRGNIIFAIK